MLLVAITCRDGISIVIATSKIFYLSKEEHEEQIHPYCSVLKNLGTEYLSEIIENDDDDDDDDDDSYYEDSYYENDDE